MNDARAVASERGEMVDGGRSRGARRGPRRSAPEGVSAERERCVGPCTNPNATGHEAFRPTTVPPASVPQRLAVVIILCGCSSEPEPAGTGPNGVEDAGQSQTGGSSGHTTHETTAGGSTADSGPMTAGDTAGDTASESGGVGCESRCEGATSVLCTDDGEEIRFDCGVLSLGCVRDSGRCEGPCAPHELSPFEGCNFSAVSTITDSSAPMAIAITALDGPAQVHIDGPTSLELLVEAGNVEFVELARLASLNDPSTSVHASGAAYRVTSTAPIRVVQYTPMASSDSSDASALLDLHAWGLEHRAVSYPDWGYQPGFVSVTAAFDGTTVTLEGVAASALAAGLGLAANGDGTLTLDAGDVVQLVTAPEGDLTGMGITADQPIQVIAGHGCTAVEFSYCDHLEEVMLPLSLSGDRFAVGLTPADDGQPGETLVRVVAFEAGTSVTVVGGSVPDFELAAPGDFAEFALTSAVATIEASAAVVVGEYLLSDRKPSLALARPQPWRPASVLVPVPAGFDHHLQAVCPGGTALRVDGGAEVALASVNDHDLYLRALTPGVHEVSFDVACTVGLASFQAYASTFTRL